MNLDSTGTRPVRHTHAPVRFVVGREGTYDFSLRCAQQLCSSDSVNFNVVTNKVKVPYVYNFPL